MSWHNILEDLEFQFITSGILTAATVMIAVFWDVTLCGLVNIYWCLEETSVAIMSLDDRGDEGSRFLCNFQYMFS